MTPQQLLMLQMMQSPQGGANYPWMAGAMQPSGPQINPILMNALMTRTGGMDPATQAMMTTPQQQGGANPMLWAMLMNRWNPQAQMTQAAGM